MLGMQTVLDMTSRNLCRDAVRTERLKCLRFMLEHYNINPNVLLFVFELGILGVLYAVGNGRFVWSPVSICVEPNFRLCGAQFQFVWNPISDCVEPSFSLCGAQFQIVCSPVSDCVEPSFRLCGAQLQIVWSPVSNCV